MRRISRIVYPLVLLLLLASCSSPSISATSNKDFKMSLPSLDKSDTCSEEYAGKIMCIFSFEITSLADAPKSLTGKFFALTDGKIYLADDSPNISNSISGTWNPGDKKTGYIAFTLPSKSTISSIFIGPKGTSSIDDAFINVPINYKAIDSAEKKIQDEAAAMKKVNEMLSRWREVSEYPWDANPDLSEMENVDFVAVIFKDKRAKNSPEGGVYPECFGNVVTNMQSGSVTDFANKYNGIVFEDLLSGFGIIIEKDVMYWEDCNYILSEIPGVRKLP
jgi:hypothetical protein